MEPPSKRQRSEKTEEYVLSRITTTNQPDADDKRNYMQVETWPGEYTLLHTAQQALDAAWSDAMLCMCAGTYPGAPCYIWNMLPNEHYDMIAAFLSPRDIAVFKQTSKGINIATTLTKLKQPAFKAFVGLWFDIAN